MRNSFNIGKTLKVNVFPLILLTFFCLFAQFIYGENIRVAPAYILFDCKVECDSDALTTADNQGYQIQDPEWDSSESPQIKYKPAYISKQKDRTISVCFRTLNENYLNTNMHLIITLTVTDSNGIGEVCNLFIDNYIANSFREIKLNGTLPDKVGIYNFHWRWNIYAIPINQPNLCSAAKETTTEHSYYILHSVPQAPMAQPWVGVLDKACVWASGQEVDTLVIQKVTEGLYNMGDLDGDIDYTYSSNYTTNYYKFDLKKFLNAIKSSSSVAVNCTDCANLFSIFTAAVGFMSQTKSIWYGINTNQIDPIGNDYGWSAYYWTYHHFGLYNNKINDASIRLISQGNQVVPVNMTSNDYYNSLIGGNPSFNSEIYTTEVIQ